MAPNLHPLTFNPVLVPKPWGGRRLAGYGKALPPAGSFGESWEIADLPAETVTSSEQTRTIVASGPCAGWSLRDLIAAHGADLLGHAAATPGGDFPLLVKLLDAHEHLSVQVHPTADYVAAHPGTRLKTESWYVVDAEPGAVLYKGVRPGVSHADLTDAAGTVGMVELLADHDAMPGDFHHLPAGIIHALGAGVMVAEIQTPSDTTFRFYDWTEEYGRSPRDLNVDQGLAAVELAPDGAVFLGPLPGHGSRTLVETGHYWIVEHRHDHGGVPLLTTRELRILMVTRGAVRIGWDEEVFEVATGGTVLIPAVCAPQLEVQVSEPGVVLEVGL